MSPGDEEIVGAHTQTQHMYICMQQHRANRVTMTPTPTQQQQQQHHQQYHLLINHPFEQQATTAQ